MRFSYVDSRGREIEVDSVEALALRIELGAIGPDTRLYDAVSDRWAPAKEHPVYRSLASEDAEGGDEEARRGEEAPSNESAGSAGDASPSDEAGVPDRDEASGSPSDEEHGPEDPDRSDASEPTPTADDPLGLGFDLTMADEMDEASGEGDEASEPAGREDADPVGAGEDEESSEPSDPVEGEGPGTEGKGGDPWERYPAVPDAPGPDGSGTTSAEEAAEAAPQGEDELVSGQEPADGDPDEAPEADEGRDAAAQGPLDPEGGPQRTGAEGPRQRDGDRERDGNGEELPPWVAEGEALWKGETVLPDGGASGPPPSEPDRAPGERAEPPAHDVGSSETESAADVDRPPPSDESGAVDDRRPREGGGGSAGSGGGPRAEPARDATSGSRRSRRRDRGARRALRLSVLGLVGVLAVGAAVWAVEGGLWAEPEEPAEPAPLSPELRAVTAELSVAAYEDVVAALEDELRGRPLPERPPETWLSGLYLSSAGAHPGVESYWRDVRDAVASARSRESGLFRLRLDERLEARSGEPAGSAALGPDEVARVRDEAVRVYERSAVRRDSVYAGILEVAETSLRLHALLVEREEDVEYEPYSDPGVSRDPVLEAVAEDSVLRREMNARIDAFIDAVEEYGVPRPITTEGLLDHLFEGLRRVELPEPRRPAEPESTTTAERPPPQPMGAS